MTEAIAAGRRADSRSANRTSIKDWPGWDYAPGIAFLAVGVLALIFPPYASIGTSVYVGAILCVAGGFMTAGGLATINRGVGWLALALGLLSLATGLMVLYNPVQGAASLTWVLGAWFIIGGVFEFAAAFGSPVGRGWLIFVSIVNIALGVLVVTMDPKQAFAFLGYLVGISLVFRGIWALVFTVDLHKVERVVG